MIETYARTDVGRVREHNEDNVLCESLPLIDGDGYLLAVADGMGGHQAGDVASRVAVRSLSQRVGGASVHERTNLAAVLSDAVVRVNSEIRHTAETRPEYEGMGATLVAAIVDEHDAIVANVGDSRAYLVDDREIRQITRDHTLVDELVSEGVLTQSEALTHPQRHVISRALGSDPDVQPDTFVEAVGERTLLLCSDGLTSELDDETIHRAVATPEPLETIGTELVRLANERGGRDNTSVVLARRQLAE